MFMKTTIKVESRTRDLLRKLATKDQTYDDFIMELIRKHTAKEAKK